MLIARRIVSSNELEIAFAIRREVFCTEQGVSEDEEIDGRDPECRHYLALLDGQPVGTARIRPLADGKLKIERVAIRAAWRGGGHGAALMAAVLSDIEDPGAAVLNAQRQAEGFYARLGFRTVGGEFDEAGIPHVRMVWGG